MDPEGPHSAETSDCCSMYAQLSERGVTLLSEPTNPPWGTEATCGTTRATGFSVTER
jgi:hypothetical protein